MDARHFRRITSISDVKYIEIRPIFKNLKFSGNNNQQPLLIAIAFLKKYFTSTPTDRKNLLNNAPIKCIPYHWNQHLINDNVVDMAKFEFMVYQLIAEQIDTELNTTKHYKDLLIKPRLFIDQQT